MSQSNSQLATAINYMKSHWPSQVKPEWQVSLDEYPAIMQQAVADLTLAATQNRHLIRIAGVSGSGKTTQILPAVEAYCDKKNFEPILMAARRFVEYHPHYQEIKDFYGEENLRKHTDEFATIMLFFTLSELIKGGYDIVLDVTLLAPEVEAILLELTKAGNYEMLILMIAVSPTVTEHFLQGRAWRHTKATEQEFIRATSEALEFYAANPPTPTLSSGVSTTNLPSTTAPSRTVSTSLPTILLAMTYRRVTTTPAAMPKSLTSPTSPTSPYNCCKNYNNIFP